MANPAAPPPVEYEAWGDGERRAWGFATVEEATAYFDLPGADGFRGPTVVRVVRTFVATRRCDICKRMQSVDAFGNPHAPDICEGCYRAAGVDIWKAGDG